MPKIKKKLIGYHQGESSKTVFEIENMTPPPGIGGTRWRLRFDENFNNGYGEVSAWDFNKFMQEFIRDRIEDITYTPWFDTRVQKARLTIHLEIIKKNGQR